MYATSTMLKLKYSEVSDTLITLLTMVRGKGCNIYTITEILSSIISYNISKIF